MIDMSFRLVFFVESGVVLFTLLAKDDDDSFSSHHAECLSTTIRTTANITSQ